MLHAMYFYELLEMKTKYPNAKFYLITNVAPDYVKIDNTQGCKSLAPSIELEKELKLGSISKREYKKKYLDELKEPKARRFIWHIINESKEREVYLVSESEDCFYLYDYMKRLMSFAHDYNLT